MAYERKDSTAKALEKLKRIDEVADDASLLAEHEKVSSRIESMSKRLFRSGAKIPNNIIFEEEESIDSAMDCIK